MDEFVIDVFCVLEASARQRSARVNASERQSENYVRVTCASGFSSDWIFCPGVNILFFATYSPFAMRSRQRKPRARVASDLAGLSLAP
jgi:hypothetical protein